MAYVNDVVKHPELYIFDLAHGLQSRGRGLSGRAHLVSREQRFDRVGERHHSLSAARGFATKQIKSQLAPPDPVFDWAVYSL